MASPDTPEKITYFAETDYRSQRVKFGIRDDDRAKHMYIIGKTGMGKSTMLENLAVQDIQNGEGICFIDPHGGTAETLLSYVPEHRIKDVIYFAPFDQEFPVALNVMEDLGRDKRPLIVSGLIGAFKKVWVDAWSARMEYLLSNALLALLETPGSTLLGVNRMFADKNFRSTIVANVTDPSVKSFWVGEVAQYSEKCATEAAAAMQNKVGQFAANPLIRNMVGQPKSTFDIRQVMDERKILIVNLSKGRMGEGNANLVGSMLITKIYLAAMSRADVGAEVVKSLPPFYLYVDEFQSFANESFADILSEARKYKLSLTIAHQYIEQMSEEVRAAVFGNVGSMISFRVGAYDAEVLEKEYAPAFTGEDMVNLGFAQIYLKLMIRGVGSAPFSATTLAPVKKPAIDHAPDVIASSRALFARPRAEVEAEIVKWHEPVGEPARDPNAASVPETRKYAPGMRPQQREEGRGPRPAASATAPASAGARTERAANPDALRSALQAAMIERSPSTPVTLPKGPIMKPASSSGLPPVSSPPPTPIRVPTPMIPSKPAFTVPRAPYAPLAISPAVHTPPRVPPPVPLPPAPLVPPTPVAPFKPFVQKTETPRTPAPHRPFAEEFAKLSPAPVAPLVEKKEGRPENTPPAFHADRRTDSALRVNEPHRNNQGERPFDRTRPDRESDRSTPPALSSRTVPPERREGQAPVSPLAPNAASLSLLKSNAKKDKGPSAENLSSLRDVLRAAALPKEERPAPAFARPVDTPPVEPKKQEFLPSVAETEASAEREASVREETPVTPPTVSVPLPPPPTVFAPKPPIRPMEIPEDVLKSVLAD